LEESELVHEITGRQRNRVFSYGRYLDILMEETMDGNLPVPA
jgi:hypothetical protein